MTIQNTIRRAYDKRGGNFSDWTQNLPEGFRKTMKGLWLTHPSNDPFGQFLYNIMNTNN